MTTLPPAVVVAGSHSGAGKTTVTAVLLTAALRRGLDVRPFKIGPDFIDPGHHTAVTGRESINLDRWMMGEDGIRAAFERWSAGGDLAVIEAMGALFDGEDGSGRGSAAELAELLGAPVIIVLDVWGMTRTAAAILGGLTGFDPELPLAGWILNRVGSPAHAEMIMDALPERLRAGVLGWIRHDPELAVPERHLGLVTAAEHAVPADRRDRALAAAAAGLDLDRLLGLAPPPGGPVPAPPERPEPSGPSEPSEPPGSPGAPGSAESPGSQPEPPMRPGSGSSSARIAPDRRPRLAVAADAAFCFRYAENLRLLTAAGFTVVPFSPLADARLPADVAAVYLCGGFPESFAEQLSGNTSLAAELRARAADGTPMLAECGGLIFLGRSLTGFDGVRHPMAGVLPLDVIMDRDHLTIRYVEARTTRVSPLGRAGTAMRGQEFHQSRVTGAGLEPTLFETVDSSGRRGRDGYLSRNVVACYTHLYLGSNPGVAAALVRAAEVQRPVTGRTSVPGSPASG